MGPTIGSRVPVLRATPAPAPGTVVAPSSMMPVPGMDRIWSAVVLAENPAKAAPAPAELRPFAAKLKRIFGYNQFRIIGSAAQKIDEQTENWLVPSQVFWLGVKTRRAPSREAQGGYLVNLQLFQDNRPLLETEAKLAPGSPIFIRGPQYGDGQIIIVLQIQR
jgi:hypothetical protein